MASAAYRRQGSDRATLHEKWQRIEFGHVDARSDDPAVLVRLPDRVVEKACGGRPCWRFESETSFGRRGGRAFQFGSYGKESNSPHLPEQLAMMGMVLGVDVASLQRSI